MAIPQPAGCNEISCRMLHSSAVGVDAILRSKCPRNDVIYAELSGRKQRIRAGVTFRRPVCRKGDTSKAMWNFVPVTEDGKQVVRKVTDEDLDELGPVVLDFCTP